LFALVPRRWEGSILRSVSADRTRQMQTALQVNSRVKNARWKAWCVCFVGAFSGMRDFLSDPRTRALPWPSIMSSSTKRASSRAWHHQHPPRSTSDIGRSIVSQLQSYAGIARQCFECGNLHLHTMLAVFVQRLRHFIYPLR
jgi:hypothetical protein